MKTKKVFSCENPHPIDIHVGNKIKEARIMKGCSQEELSKHINRTFQQIQKYERGYNRVSASVLYDISQHLGYPVSFFFEGYADEPDNENDIQVDTRQKLELMIAVNNLSHKSIKNLTLIARSMVN